MKLPRSSLQVRLTITANQRGDLPAVTALAKNKQKKRVGNSRDLSKERLRKDGKPVGKMLLRGNGDGGVSELVIGNSGSRGGVRFPLRMIKGTTVANFTRGTFRPQLECLHLNCSLGRVISWATPVSSKLVLWNQLKCICSWLMLL